MPLAISVKRKYLPALSNALSLPSSHRSGRGNRNPFGGGPAGVAYRLEDVENAAEQLNGVSREFSTAVAHGRARASATVYLVEAIVGGMGGA